MSMSDDQEIERLIKELKKHRDNKNALTVACDEMSKELAVLKGNTSYESVWKEKYEHQMSVNGGLREQLAKFTKQLEELKLNNESLDSKIRIGDAHLSQLELQRRLEQLKKKKTALQWAVTDSEWRLNREGMILDQNEDSLKELQTRLDETTSRIIDSHRKKLLPSLIKTTTPGTDNQAPLPK